MNFCHRSSECHSFGDIQLQASVWACFVGTNKCILICLQQKILFFLFQANCFKLQELSLKQFLILKY